MYWISYDNPFVYELYRTMPIIWMSILFAMYGFIWWTWKKQSEYKSRSLKIVWAFYSTILVFYSLPFLVVLFSWLKMLLNIATDLFVRFPLLLSLIAISFGLLGAIRVVMRKFFIHQYRQYESFLNVVWKILICLVGIFLIYICVFAVLFLFIPLRWTPG